MSMYTFKVLPAVPESVHKARRFVRDVAEAVRFGAIDDAEFCASELVTNAVTHSLSADGGDVRITISGAPGAYLRIEVQDAGQDGPPAVVPGQPAGPDAEDGRGLYLVANLAKCWDTNGDGLWWCHFDWPAAPAPLQGDLSALAEAGERR